ncbi:unnamed protein product [Oikopleura dioica]|uniref:Lipase domain-containing protein n=1 Tax=Oikopleura dioica TaxID=34765 RepID=E4XWW9_OIKDI|nr:unnamed protein product [Oikopleura dioica]
MALLSSSSTDDETMEEDKMKKNLLSIRKFLKKHKRIIVISLSLLLFIGVFLAVFFISFLNYHCLNLEAHDENVIASLKFYDPRNQTLLDFPDEFNDSFNCSIGTVIGIHGYGDSYDTDWLAFSSTLLFNATENEGWCLFSMDWDDIAKYSYISSAKEVRSLGYWLSKTIEENPKVFDSSSLQIVGHSLGAHIAGFAGKEYFSATGTKLSKITGVDPAGPLFQTCGDKHRLSVSDADHVLTVITNSGYLFKNGMVPLATTWKHEFDSKRRC